MHICAFGGGSVEKLAYMHACMYVCKALVCANGVAHFPTDIHYICMYVSKRKCLHL